jgi:hypothetical protein
MLQHTEFYIWILSKHCPSKDLRARKTRFVAGFVFEKDDGLFQQCREFQLKIEWDNCAPDKYGN